MTAAAPPTSLGRAGELHRRRHGPAASARARAPRAHAGGTRAAARSRGTGSLDLQSRETSLDVTATRFDPVWIVGAWPGRLDGTARLRAGLAPEPNAALDAIALAGELRGYPVTLRGAAAVMGSDRYRLDALRLDSGANRVVLTGRSTASGSTSTVDAKLDELDLLVPDVDGALTAKLAIDGTWQEPRGDGEIALRNVTYAGVTVQRLDVRGAAGLAADARVDLDGRGRRARARPAARERARRHRRRHGRRARGAHRAQGRGRRLERRGDGRPCRGRVARHAR